MDILFEHGIYPTSHVSKSDKVITYQKIYYYVSDSYLPVTDLFDSSETMLKCSLSKQYASYIDAYSEQSLCKVNDISCSLKYVMNKGCIYKEHKDAAQHIIKTLKEAEHHKVQTKNYKKKWPKEIVKNAPFINELKSVSFCLFEIEILLMLYWRLTSCDLLSEIHRDDAKDLFSLLFLELFEINETEMNSHQNALKSRKKNRRRNCCRRKKNKITRRDKRHDSNGCMFDNK